MNDPRESAVGRLLREHGVGGDGPDAITVRKAEQLTGVSRQTIATWLRPVDPAKPVRHTNKNLDLIANGLEIDRRRLGMASMIDNGAAVEIADEGSMLAQLGEVQRQIRAALETVTQVIDSFPKRDPSEDDMED